eukprot:3689905-Rhodomonas_salina.1
MPETVPGLRLARLRSKICATVDSVASAPYYGSAPSSLALPIGSFSFDPRVLLAGLRRGSARQHPPLRLARASSTLRSNASLHPGL